MTLFDIDLYSISSSNREQLHSILFQCTDYNKALLHYSRCCDTECISTNCLWAKSSILHSYFCHLKLDEHCHDCQKAVAICIMHTIKCEESNCPVYFCTRVKIHIHEKIGKKLTLGQKIRLSHFYQEYLAE